MAVNATMRRFAIELSDVDRGVYDTLDLRVAQHPSEGTAYLVTRVLAYALHYEDGIEFSAGVSLDEAAVRVVDPTGVLRTWIEVGQPAATKLNRATKAADEVWIYTYKKPQHLQREAASRRVHRLEEVRAFALSPEFLEPIERSIDRQNVWTVVRTDGVLMVSAGDEAAQTELERVPLC